MTGGGDPFYRNFWVKLTARWSDIADFRSILDRSASAETTSEKRSIKAIRCAQDEHCTLSLSPQSGLKNAVSNI